MKKMILPKITKLKKPLLNNDLPIDTISYSKLARFSTNPFMFKVNYINGDQIDSLMNISGIIGRAFHFAMHVYYGGSDEHIVTSEEEAVQQSLLAGADYIEQYNEGFIKFSSTIKTKQKAIEKVTFMIKEYIKEQGTSVRKKDNILKTEEEISEYVDVEWQGKRIHFPVKLKGYIDKVYRDPKGELCIEDYKTVASFSNPDKVDGRKMLQAVEYFFLVYAKYGEEPQKIRFTEVKMSKTIKPKPGELPTQTKTYVIDYKDNILFFEFYFRLYEDMIKSLNGQAVYVPNVDSFFDSDISIIAYIHRLDVEEEKAKKMRENATKTITETLKKEIEKGSTLKTFEKSLEKYTKNYQPINYSKMSIEDKVTTKLLEFGILLKFDSKITGLSFTQYRFSPSMGVKMTQIESHIKDIEQVVGLSGIRILAPIPDTSFVGVEIPNKEREYVTEPGVLRGDFEVAMGVNITKETVYFDIRKAPHMLIAGVTGSGKSVFMGSIIQQLSQSKKSEIHLHDPKMVELSLFESLPNVKHYSYEAEDILQNLIHLESEMNKRYAKMKAKLARNIEEYNQKGGRMKYIFVFIDEFGDLINSKGTISALVERQILVLAQKARACGIHIIISTQRPSVDIISGSIKSQFPTKVAFRMSKAIDSNIVLDESGAEKLLGKGDMLFSDENGIERLQGFNS